MWWTQSQDPKDTTDRGSQVILANGLVMALHRGYCSSVAVEEALPAGATPLVATVTYTAGLCRDLSGAHVPSPTEPRASCN